MTSQISCVPNQLLPLSGAATEDTSRTFSSLTAQHLEAIDGHPVAGSGFSKLTNLVSSDTWAPSRVNTSHWLRKQWPGLDTSPLWFAALQFSMPPENATWRPHQLPPSKAFVSSHDKPQGFKRSTKGVTFMVFCWSGQAKKCTITYSWLYNYPSLRTVSSAHTLCPADSSRGHVSKSIGCQSGMD